MYYFYLWLGIFIAAIILEIITAEALVCIWFAPGALMALIANQFGLSFHTQILLFFIISILSFIIIRPLASKYLRGNTIATNADRLIGQRAFLLKAINEDTMGEIKINGITWNCKAYNQKHIPQKAQVEILAIEGSKLIVKEI